MTDIKIKDFTVNDAVTGFFAVRKKEVRDYTRGRYVQLELGDNTGRIKGIVWEPDTFCLDELVEGSVVKVRGSVTEYQSQRQLTIKQIRLAKEDEYAIEDILPHSTQPEKQRRMRILSITDKVENTYIQSLLRAFWEDEAFMDAFLKAAAGKLWHHAHVGGLSEHSANVAEMALEIGSRYDFLNRDYLIFGGLLHDVGKVTSYRINASIDYTDEGRLIGHICLADAWICERVRRIETFPNPLLVKLRHILLSHQGELAYASPVVPQIPEAFIVYYCDEIDSKMGAIERIGERQQSSGWSPYVKMLDRFLYFPKKGD